MSSRLMIALTFSAYWYSEAGVAFEENMISSPLQPSASGEHQLCHGRTVAAAAVFPQNIDQKRIRAGFHRKVFPVSLIPSECLSQRLGIFTDPLLIIQMKGVGIVSRISSSFCFVTNGFLVISYSSSLVTPYLA